ncbi:GNAT family N-acetyltransferase [Edaphobacillus lindanitolerans]|uniref:ElaA protein n=1 Tax=Edaphobacillus lindanitolerans TaxID=550447 RepID=A0A1U7PQA2_9BACI|nr:GNAT family N-acetyltransferase [Edaphobacillus lindanitolerans]SIT89454.1 ElaA protein [Edaphobacillus lindanitolerans]
MEWKVKRFQDLTLDELYEIIRLRVDVFVVEQRCIYGEVDGHDRQSLHLIGTDDGEICAYSRILPPGERYEEPSIGRVVVRMAWRGNGLARELVERAKRIIRDEWGGVPVRLQAQEHLEPFYQSCGFGSISEPYDDEGVPHVDMRMSVS